MVIRNQKIINLEILSSDGDQTPNSQEYPTKRCMFAKCKNRLLDLWSERHNPELKRWGYSNTENSWLEILTKREPAAHPTDTNAHLTFKLFFSSFFLIQFSACCCGSIHSGYRLAWVVRIPFSIDSSSGGSPSDVHRLISTSLVRKVSSLKGWLTGMFRFRTSFSHSPRYMSYRKSQVKAPR